MRQNATFQESHKTKLIPIVFAILKDFSHHFEGVFGYPRALKFCELIPLELYNVLGMKPKNLNI